MELQMMKSFILLLIMNVSIWANPVLYNVLDYGAETDGKTLSTEAIQNAVNACAQVGGGKVIVPPGKYLTGPIILKSNVHIEIMTGAILYAHENIDQYPAVPGRYEGIEKRTYASLFTGHDLHNVSITGRGILNGQGKVWWDAHLKTKEIREKHNIVDREPLNPPKSPLKWPRPRVINLYRCNNVLIRDLTILDSPSWTIHPVYCKNVTIENITIKQPYESPNTDGINPESCNYVRITNCFIDCGDDCITIKSGYNEDGRRVNIPCQNIVIANCTFAHGRSAIGIGSETSGGVRNVAISNCIFQDTYRGLRIKTARGRGNTVENIRATNIVMDNVETGISIDMRYNEDELIKLPVDETTPFFKNIRYSHISGINIKKAGEILGLPESPINGITLTDVFLSAETGLEVDFVQDLTMQEVEINTEQGSPLKISNSKDLNIDNFDSKNSENDTPIIVVENISDAVFSQRRLSENPKSFLLEKGNNNEVEILQYK